jgi:hypothetical protein
VLFKHRLTSRRSQPPLALSVPLTRFTSLVGGGSAFFVRRRYTIVRFTVHILDDDEPAHTQICVAERDYSAGQDSYVSAEEFIAFGRALQSFPQTRGHEAVFESGSRDSRYSCFIRLRAFERDLSGHAAFEVEMSNHAVGASHCSAHFHIFTEAAVLNRLGQSLESWARSERKEFEFTDESRDA